ncbi:hypothetical protein SAMN04487968_107185 [Nocardioides terrae]|uniref:LTD domain-containing protein n=1 Tax=Nocardioides terrae TaxID=574651 RepID=A0A1I1K5S9_9ACTN|nr:ExeM/NucH family extracellular endonuclease [Nocardioides terrae]SFC52910.1 hypothetical protein SAMN04487968_107185 [Nocardioides terrae]
MSSSRRVGIVAALGLAVAAISPLLATAPADANTSGTALVISEVYGAGGNNGAAYNADFVELYNPTSANLPLSGLALHYRSAAGGSGGTPYALSGSVPAHGHWLVQMSAAGANGSALPTPDATASPAFSMAAAGGQVALQQGTAVIATSGDVRGVAGIVDFVGASGAASYETAVTGSAASAAQSLNRSADGADTDSNAADFTLAAPSPTGSGGVAAGLTVTSPGDPSVTVGTPLAPITLSATGGTAPYYWSSTTLPAGVTLDRATGVISGTPTATGSTTVTVTATDASTPAKTGTASFKITVNPPPTMLSIGEIQGASASSPHAGELATTTGVVTADYDHGGFNGIYIQDPSGNPDDTSSDAIFVFGSGVPASVEIGDSVSVTGKVSEFQGTTELTPASGGVVTLTSPLGPVEQLEVPWTALDTDAEKEAHEGELVEPTGDFTVSDNFDANFFGSFVLAAGDRPLTTPTEVADAQDPAAVQDVVDANNAKKVTLDDGASVNYNGAANKNTPLPWLTPANPVRVGSAVTFHQPFVLEYRFDAWNLQPTEQVTDDGHEVATFSDTRTPNLAPRDVGGDIKLATFNVLNYFPTTGEEYVDSGLGTCTWFDDRAGNHIGDDTCTGTNKTDPGPRGAATAESLARQQVKIVKAINGLGASIVSLEELENSVWFGKDRDFAIGKLVDALNAQAGAGTWAFAPSPAASGLPALADQDVIRTGFIYKPAAVSLVGVSHVLSDQSADGQAFDNAREPLAQGFKRLGAPDSDAFLVIVNHFKSKGSGVDDGTGQGNANPDRIAQAHALVDFAAAQGTALGTDKVFFTGDFNAYSMEDPIQVIEAAGYRELNGEFNDGEATYSFDGMDGSLDHVFASPAAEAWVTGVDVWQINAQEQVGFEYSRYNYNATILYDDSVFRASDHNPEIVGLDLPEVTYTPTVDAADTTVVFSKEAPRIVVRVTADGVVPTGTVDILDGDRVVGTGTLVDGRAVVTLPKKSFKRGVYTLTAAYAGNGPVLAGTDTFTLTVTNPNGK